MKNQDYIAKAMNGETFELKDMESFTTWEEAQPFLIEVGRQARKIAEANIDSFFASKMMGEIEQAYYRALHADCGFMVNVNAETAMGWFVKMVNTYGINQ